VYDEYVIVSAEATDDPYVAPIKVEPKRVWRLGPAILARRPGGLSHRSVAPLPINGGTMPPPSLEVLNDAIRREDDPVRLPPSSRHGRRSTV
jgi:hypothetical protein